MHLTIGLSPVATWAKQVGPPAKRNLTSCRFGENGCGSKPCTPGERQNRWQMEVHPPQNGIAIGYAPWPNDATPKQRCVLVFQGRPWQTRFGAKGREFHPPMLPPPACRAQSPWAPAPWPGWPPRWSWAEPRSWGQGRVLGSRKSVSSPKRVPNRLSLVLKGSPFRLCRGSK